MNNKQKLIEVSISPSLSMFIISVFLYFMAIISIWFTSLPNWIAIILSILAGIHAYHFYCLYFFRNLKQSVFAIRYLKSQWWIKTQKGWKRATLKSDIWITSWLITFSLLNQKNKNTIRYHICLWHDSSSKTSLHALRLHLLLNRSS